jgi:pimeloyl-ACP methyl ester carboxylesterase
MVDGMTMISSPTSKWVDLDGETHYLDFGGPDDGPLVVCVHGLGGAAWNWVALGPLLINSVRVLAIDLAGHGLTPAAGRSTTIGANRRLLDRFLREVGAGESAVLVGNSMGGLITMLEAAASPELVSGAVLVDPALPRPVLSGVDAWTAARFAITAAPTIGATIYARRRRTLSARKAIRAGLALCMVDIDRMPEEVYAAAEQVIRQRDPERFPTADIGRAGRSIMRRMSRASELRRTMETITAPVLLIHGDQDRLIPFSSARRTADLFPKWRFEVAHDLGHVPMLEAPQWTADTLLAWMRTDAHILA